MKFNGAVSSIIKIEKEIENNKIYHKSSNFKGTYFSKNDIAIEWKR